ncbi:hypothetical protein [Marivirga sp.]|uniref:hypothetical protein n=1 Tax=Marivirga sp. TaxID=2018662 RepID=UPI0025CCAC90|nr:hypothetical protein [Marivirga sp.]
MFTITSCNLDPLPEDQLPSFDKLYAVSLNVEAVDFICKPNASGYIIVGNLKSTENSDIIIIDVGTDGMQRNLHRINTPTFDEAVSAKLYEDDNSVLILGHRKSDPSQANIGQNILIKSNLDGIPIRADNVNSEDTISAEFKILTINENNPVQLNDFLIIPPNLIAVGRIRESPTGASNRITQIFDITSASFNNKNDSLFDKIREKPDAIVYDNSRSLKIRKGNTPSVVYEVMGQNISENPNGEVNGVSLNISWDIYTNLESGASERIYIGTDTDEAFGDILFHSNGKNYIAGNYVNTDTVFLISKEYTGVNNNVGQKIYTTTEYGNKVSSLTEDDDGNIIMALIDETDINNNSLLLKFSQAGEPIEDQNLKFISTGLYNIKKIENEAGNILVILSQKTFENNSTAIGLMKIKF